MSEVLSLAAGRSLSELGFSPNREGLWCADGHAFEVVDFRDQGTLGEVAALQEEVWQFGEHNIVPEHVLSIAGKTGGNVLIARDTDGRLNGFVLTFGGRDNALLLHMIGVTPERQSRNLGFNLLTYQAVLARQEGTDHIFWTYDPLLGKNAKLYLEKVGGIAYEYTIDMYGKVTGIYGVDPTDRLTVHWNLAANRTWNRLRQIVSGHYRPLSLTDVRHLPIYENGTKMGDQCLVEIPAVDPQLLLGEEKVQWRLSLRRSLGELLQSESRDGIHNGGMMISGFATGADDLGKTRSFYVLEHRG
jgi:predicted GNAT superfamily acetyltransferase